MASGAALSAIARRGQLCDHTGALSVSLFYIILAIATGTLVFCRTQRHCVNTEGRATNVTLAIHGPRSRATITAAFVLGNPTPRISRSQIAARNPMARGRAHQQSLFGSDADDLQNDHDAFAENEREPQACDKDG